jgi:hypothetical protein
VAVRPAQVDCYQDLQKSVVNFDQILVQRSIYSRNIEEKAANKPSHAHARTAQAASGSQPSWKIRIASEEPQISDTIPGASMACVGR